MQVDSQTARIFFILELVTMASYILWPVLHHWYLRRKWQQQDRERISLLPQELPRPVNDFDDHDYLADDFAFRRNSVQIDSLLSDRFRD